MLVTIESEQWKCSLPMDFCWIWMEVFSISSTSRISHAHKSKLWMYFQLIHVVTAVKWQNLIKLNITNYFLRLLLPKFPLFLGSSLGRLLLMCVFRLLLNVNFPFFLSKSRMNEHQWYSLVLWFSHRAKLLLPFDESLYELRNYQSQSLQNVRNTSRKP